MGGAGVLLAFVGIPFGWWLGVRVALGFFAGRSQATPRGTDWDLGRSMRPIPTALVEAARALACDDPRREVQGFDVRGGEWTIHPAFRGYLDPPPAKQYCFGKQGSCLRDRQGRMSCAEIEIARRLRSAGWMAGWISPYSGDPPARWRRWTWTIADAVTHVPDEFGAFRDWLANRARAGGTPDVIAINGRDLVTIECKRHGSTDKARTTQVAWAKDVRRALGPDHFLVAEWYRLPAPSSAPKVLPWDEPTAAYPTGRPPV